MAHLDSQVAKRLSPSRSITGITTEVGVEVGPVLAALACSRMSAVSLTDVCRLRRRGRPLVPAVRRPTGRTTLPAHPGASTMTARQDRHRGRRRGLARIAARTRVRLGAITRRPYERSIVHESSPGPRSRRLALSVVSPRLEAVGTTDAGGTRRLGRSTKTEGRQEDSSKGESTGRPFAVLGAKLASGQGRLASFARARSGHRTSCWARPGSRRWGTMKRRVTSGSRSVAA